jgi:hemolysin activation/secretion protein
MRAVSARESGCCEKIEARVSLFVVDGELVLRVGACPRRARPWRVAQLCSVLLATLALGAASAVSAAPRDGVTRDARPNAPATAKPETAAPDVSRSGADKAGLNRPAVEKPDGAKSDSAKSDGKPNGAKPDGAKPDGTKPDGTKPDTAKPVAGPPAPVARFDIDEFRVEGADTFAQIEVEEAVYPFLGPNRSSDDVEKARAALEKAYHDKGYQTVSVAIPQQKANRGFVVLKVSENRVGRLRVKGSRYFDLDEIKRKAASVQEGKLPNFEAVTKDIVSLNQLPDRRVTPALRAGTKPGTVDVDLNVEDKFPLHGNVELNNRQSPSTTATRFNASVRYDNLWQFGHSLSYTYQVAPERPSDAEVFSASYLARTNLDWLNILTYGLNSASSVATVGGANVVGPGTVIGTRGVITLPTSGQLFHTVSLGIDYKRFGETVAQGLSSFSTPVTYVPVVGGYAATWQGEGRLIQLNATITAGLRGFGSDPNEFDAKRFKATANFISLRSDVSYTQDLADGVQFFVKGQGQLTDQPLVSSEQFSLGGLDTVRGYLESEALGDFGGSATVELRSPNLAPFLTQTLKNAKTEPEKVSPLDEWGVFGFVDAGRVRIFNPLAEQQEQFDLASYGIGTHFKFMKYSNGIILVGVPMISQQATTANKSRVSFRFWGEF